jgi:hypothetical protein
VSGAAGASGGCARLLNKGSVRNSLRNRPLNGSTLRGDVGQRARSAGTSLPRARTPRDARTARPVVVNGTWLNTARWRTIRPTTAVSRPAVKAWKDRPYVYGTMFLVEYEPIFEAWAPWKTRMRAPIGLFIHVKRAAPANRSCWYAPDGGAAVVADGSY